MVSENEPQMTGAKPWMIKYDVMVNATAFELTERSFVESVSC